MKKVIRLMSALALVALLGLAVACGDDDKDKTIEYGQLPAKAREFINTYFSADEVVRVTLDKVESPPKYDVYFRSGAEVEFTIGGDWEDVKAPVGAAVPAGIVPEKITAYVIANYPGSYISEISVEFYGYEVDLSNGIDLEFDRDGVFLRAD